MGRLFLTERGRVLRSENEEISRWRWARKRLDLPTAAADARADLWLFLQMYDRNTEPLEVELNGRLIGRVAPDARLAVMEIKWGLIPDMSGMVLLRGLVRDDVARELTWTGRIFNGAEAVSLGIATRVADDPHADIGVEARLVAGLLLNAALEKRTGLDEALSQSPARDLPPSDRAFARAVAMAALRRLGEIDQILERRLQKTPPLAVMTILRIALAQTLVLETPAFAAVSTAVKLAERDPKTRPYKNLVNAVLRKISDELALQRAA